MIPEQPLSHEAPLGYRPGARLPLARPIATNVLLVLIGIVFLLETVLGGSTNTRTLVGLGAQVNILIAFQGEYWRLLTSTFLHIGMMHLLFNGWALFSLGREVEAFYGTLRFIVIYFAAGLFGGVAFYIFGAPNVPSAGASGAIFGLVGAEIAFFFRNRRLFGQFSRQQLSNLLGLVVINLIFGFTVPGINNLAHLGGLMGGLAVGLGLAPHYEVRWEGLIAAPRLTNRTGTPTQVLAGVLAVVAILGGIQLGDRRWEDRLQDQSQNQAVVVADVKICPPETASDSRI